MPRRKQLAPLEQDSGGAMIERRGLLHGLRAGRRLRMIPQILALVAVLSIGALPHPYPRSVPALALPATRGVCASPGSACTPAGSRHADAARAGDGLLGAHPPPPAHGPPPARTCKRARSRAHSPGKYDRVGQDGPPRCRPSSGVLHGSGRCRGAEPGRNQGRYIPPCDTSHCLFVGVLAWRERDASVSWGICGQIPRTGSSRWTTR